MSWVRKAICQLSQLVIPVFQGGGADHDDEDDSVGSNLIAIIKLVNKESYNGDKSAAIRQARRDCGPSLRCAHHRGTD